MTSIDIPGTRILRSAELSVVNSTETALNIPHRGTERIFLPERDYVTFWYLPSQICLPVVSVVCVSLTFVCHIQGVEAFSNISSRLCTLAIL